MQKFILAISSGLGLGYSPVAPGTAGSVLGVVIALAYSRLGGHEVISGPAYLAICVLVTIVGVWAAGRAEAIYGQKDCGKIVIDEVAGMLITMYLLPATPLYLFAGFLVFRFFDIVKPFPARRIDQNVKGGLGVMLDDVVAGVYSCLCLHVIRAVAS